ncbi:MAG: amidase family protein [Proteobacteria bacterium]|nr:amidase family protein [Pseudomonadota bacterium]MDA0927826.1 amidase family protein [Pseudomonadota bacterium]
MTLLSRLLLALYLTTVSISALAAESDYDQAADLAQLAQHENERMHYILLKSRVQDISEQWQPFSAELDAFGESRYQQLKPLILEASVADLQAAVAAGDLDYTTITTFYLYRIREIESDSSRFLNGIIALNPNAIDRARELDAARRQALEMGRDPIYGIPVLLKDNVNAAGMATTAGAVALQQNHTGDAFITDQLRSKGAIILGKANLSEWAYYFCGGCPSGYSAVGGQTLNPYGRLEFNTGGSSAGSGATIAANYAAVAVGSETSGSILSPASANSLVGLKPTTGSLSRSGVIPISGSLDTTGPMTRNVADAVILFNAMAGYDQADSAMPLLSDGYSLEYREPALTGKRLGALSPFLDNPFFSEALAVMGEDGAVIVDVEMPDYDREGFSELLGGEMVRDLALYLENHGATQLPIDSVEALQQFNLQNMDIRAPYGQSEVDMMVGLEMSADELEVLRERLQRGARSVMESMFSDNDVIALLSVNNSSAGFAALANYPALTIPMGYEENGRPVGLTIIAPSFNEQVLVDIGARFEALTRARRIPPDYQ